MSDRPNHRGGRGGGGGHGGNFRGGRGGGRGGGGGGGGNQSGERERPKKENILDLAKYMDKQINVKFNGGREGMQSAIPPETTPWVQMLTTPSSQSRAR